MLRFFEQEPKTCWLVPDAPQDLYKHPTTCDHRIFPLQAPSIFIDGAGNVTGSSGIESRVRGSNVSLQVERFSYDRGCLNSASQDCNSFQFEPFSSSAPLKQLPGQSHLTTNPLHPRGSGFATLRDAMHDAKKQNEIIMTEHHIIDERAIMGRQSKRFKVAHDSMINAPVITVKKSQKLGDKITALQQLVSPFGKTDTASVLQEASVYIKALHEQIRVLSSPYFGTITSHGFQGNGGENRSIRSKGLSLVPISVAVTKLIEQKQHDYHTVHL